jgi:hypothetical protein
MPVLPDKSTGRVERAQMRLSRPAMMVHQVDHILTFDLNDFKRYRGITVVHPMDVT